MSLGRAKRRAVSGAPKPAATRPVEALYRELNAARADPLGAALEHIAEVALMAHHLVDTPRGNWTTRGGWWVRMGRHKTRESWPWGRP